MFPQFGQGILNSYTQIFFAKNKWMALLLIGVSFVDLNAGLSGLLAVLIANTAAYLIGLNREHIINGFYGFNPLLVGLGYGISFQPGVSFYIILIFITLLTLFSSILLAGLLNKYGLPYLSLPFLIGFWIIMLTSRSIGQLELSEGGIYFLNELYLLGGFTLLDLHDWFDQLLWPEVFKLYFRSLGALFFQPYLFIGIIIALGLLIWSRLALMLSFLGFACAYLFYLVVGASLNELSYSYIGFNFILTSIAIGGFFVIPSVYSFLWVIISIPLLAFLQITASSLLAPLQLSVLSLPFNFVVISFLFVFRFRERYFDKPALVYFQQFQPEKNLYSTLINNRRLAHLERIPMKLPFWGFWKVTQAFDGKHTHKDAWRFAWDFEFADENGKTYKNEGLLPTDYYCFGKPVLAPASGYVMEIIGEVDDNAIGDMNLRQNWGNSIVINHGEGLFSQLSHLQKGSLLVHKGQYVEQGTQLANCGNSGRSPYPHLHFQFQTSSEIGAHTLSYPFAAYLSKNEELHFHSSDQPKLNDLVCNQLVDDSLNRALHFIPGQTLKFEVSDHELINWEVKTDIFNQSYLACDQTKSKAWFGRKDDLFYFTRFEGNKKSLLYDFYLGAYQLVTGNNPGLTIQEQFSLSEFPSVALRILQDVIAPFYRFLTIHFKATQLKAKQSIGNTPILFNTQISFIAFNKTLSERSYQIAFEAGEMKRFEIKKENQQLILNRV
ncbi:MAG TPA: urea transporter [Bacteroidales bacterium]|nr:urea transporter [Bacteroidales bacterium]